MRNRNFILIFLGLSRLLSMLVMPLTDPTEARYGEMARKMLVSGDWITLWHQPGVPFWAKPPLGIWFSAFSMKLLGLNAFAARFPGFLCEIAVLAIFYNAIKNYRTEKEASGFLLVLAGSLFYLPMGTVMTDPALLLGVTLSQVMFWRALHESSKLFGYLFFVGLAIGLLAKGPLTFVFVGVPIFFWALFAKKWSNVWQQIPWINGGMLMIALALPWYVLAELKTPGFLSYFIFGEHFGRFLQASWPGDKYGHAHAQVHGTILGYAFIALLPWTLLLFRGLLKAESRNQLCFFIRKKSSSWERYWLLCFVIPLLFFTAASNIIGPYVLPSMPAFAVLFGSLWCDLYPKNDKLSGWASMIGVILVMGSFVFYFYPQVIEKSQYRVVKSWLRQPDHYQNPLVFFGDRVEFSAEFYSNGRVIAVQNLRELCHKLNPNKPVFVVQETREEKIGFKEVDIVGVRGKRISLLRADHFPCWPI